MNTSGARSAPSSVASLVVICGAVALLTAAIEAGVGRHGLMLLSFSVVALSIATVYCPSVLSWRQLLALLVVVILFIPMRRYALPGSLPFQLEPYRLFVALVVVGWLATLLIDRRVHFRRTGFEGPLALIVGSVIGSDVANTHRLASVSSEVTKSLTFFVSFLLVLYMISSVIRRLEDVDYLVKVLVFAGGVVGFFAVIEARTGFNIFNHLSRVIPFLTYEPISGPAFIRTGTAKLRVFASAEHPIALSAALVMLIPLAVYLWRRYRRRRWALCTLALTAGALSTVSRTGVVMLVVVGIVFLWLRPRQTRRLWPALLPALVVIHFAVPGTLGAIKESFLPKGGLIAEQKSDASGSGSGRLADLGPGLRRWQADPLLGEGYGTLVVDASKTGINANIFDDQWLGTLLAVGAFGFVGWVWFFGRAIRRLARESKNDDSDRGWLLTGIAASIGAYAIGMVTFDAFAFVQVTFLLFILTALASALLAERPTPLAERIRRERRDVLNAPLRPASDTT